MKLEVEAITEHKLPRLLLRFIQYC